MEVHKFTDILGVTLTQDVYEGRMALLSAAGAKLPVNSTEAALARYLVAWPVDNREPPIYQTYPSYTQALRYGFEKATNLPVTSATLYYTYPGLVDEAQTIPSGTGALLYDKGEFSVGWGQWIYDATIVIGTTLEVSTSSSTRGQLTKKSSGTAVAVCTAIDLTYKKLTFRTYGEGN